MKTIVCTLLGMLLCYLPTASAANTGKALIIGVESYEKAPPLRFVKNDVTRLAEALSDRCGYDVTMLIDSAITELQQPLRPTTHRDAMMKQIEDWLAAVRPTDNVVVFFSGHGFLGENQELYLAAIDCDPNKPLPGGISVAWLKDRLNRCQSAHKFLVLDACHSGATKGRAVLSASAKSIVVEFAGVRGATTFASCQGDESSYIWSMKQQSLFTFWLTRGIQGHADINGDGQVDLDELTLFVTSNVATVAERQLGQQQTPTVVGNSDNAERLTFVTKPLLLKRLIADMADQLDTQIRCEQFSSVGVVPSFSCGDVDARLSLDYGALPTFIAAQLRQQLVLKSRGAYRIVSENAMREALQQAGAGIRDVGASKTKSLVAKGGGEQLSIPAIVSGRLHHREAAIVRLSSTLLHASEMADVAMAGGAAILSESERAMIPDSVSMLASLASDQDAPPIPDEDSHQVSSLSPAAQRDEAFEQHRQRVEFYDQQAQQRHPLLDPKFPFRLAVSAKSGEQSFQKRQLSCRGNKCFVSLQRGEVYKVHVVNRSDKPVWMRLMVDGLNTLSQNTGVVEQGAGITQATTDTRTVAPRVSLAEARGWRLQPGKVYVISGFYEPGDVAYREFAVVDAADSAAAKMQFTENIGLITAAFYEEQATETETEPANGSHSPRQQAFRSPEEVFGPQPIVPRSPANDLPMDDPLPPDTGLTPRAIGTDFGAQRQQKLDRYQGEGRLGRLMAVVHLQYQERP